MSNKRRLFTKDFKEEAVQHWQESGKSAEEVAVALGLPDGKYLSRWKHNLLKKGADAFPGNGKQLGKDAEIAKLRRQLKDIEQERDILKKHCAFSQSPKSQTSHLELALSFGEAAKLRVQSGENLHGTVHFTERLLLLERRIFL